MMNTGGGRQHLFLFSEHDCAPSRNSLMVFGSIIEQVNMECCMQELQLCLFSFSNYVPWSIFLLENMVFVEFPH